MDISQENNKRDEIIWDIFYIQNISFFLQNINIKNDLHISKLNKIKNICY